VKELPQISDNAVRSPTSGTRLKCALSPVETSDVVAAFSCSL
jgi:hypothetical protein